MKPPASLKRDGRGRRFWDDVTGAYEGLRPDELAALQEAASLLDRIDALDAIVERDGLMIEGARGRPELHPAVAESRQLRLALRAYLKQLKLPDPATGETDTTRSARAAASARWRRRTA